MSKPLELTEKRKYLRYICVNGEGNYWNYYKSEFTNNLREATLYPIQNIVSPPTKWEKENKTTRLKVLLEETVNRKYTIL